jgi:hypothetical protein
VSDDNFQAEEDDKDEGHDVDDNVFIVDAHLGVGLRVCKVKISCSLPFLKGLLRLYVLLYLLIVSEV